MGIRIPAHPRMAPGYPPMGLRYRHTLVWPQDTHLSLVDMQVAWGPWVDMQVACGPWLDAGSLGPMGGYAGSLGPMGGYAGSLGPMVGCR